MPTKQDRCFIGNTNQIKQIKHTSPKSSHLQPGSWIHGDIIFLSVILTKMALGSPSELLPVLGKVLLHNWRKSAPIHELQDEIKDILAHGENPV